MCIHEPSSPAQFSNLKKGKIVISFINIKIHVLIIRIFTCLNTCESTNKLISENSLLKT